MFAMTTYASVGCHGCVWQLGAATDDVRRDGVLAGRPAGKWTARGIVAGHAQGAVVIAPYHELHCGIKVGRVRIVTGNTFDLVVEEFYRGIGSEWRRGRQRQFHFAIVQRGHGEPKRMTSAQISAKVIGRGEGALHGYFAAGIGLADCDGTVVAAQAKLAAG